MEILYFDLAIRITHFFNFFFIILLIRSGIEIIGAHPKFYFNDDCENGKDWIRFTKIKMPENKLWTAEDEIQPYSPWIALPGRNNLGLGRHWHFWSVTGWLLNGAVYIIALFVSDHWRSIIPDSWSIFPEAGKALASYITFEVPSKTGFFNPLQQLIYFILIFIVTPLQILTGIAMSPAIAGRFPTLANIFGGRQGARSFHLIGLFIFSIFIITHVCLVIVHGFGEEMAKIVLGQANKPHDIAIIIGLGATLLVILFNIYATRISLSNSLKTKKMLEIGIDPLRKKLFHYLPSLQQYNRISPNPRVNGKPPQNNEYLELCKNNFEDYIFQVNGLVKYQKKYTLADLKSLPFKVYSTRHNCIQGWTYFANWRGIPVKEIIKECQPIPDAKYLVFHTLDEKWEKPGHGYYYEVIDMEIALKEQTYLAFEMNGEPLPVEFGAPLRLRVESQLGYKMAKWVCGIEFTKTFEHIGKGQGGWRDDVLNYFPSDGGI